MTHRFCHRCQAELPPHEEGTLIFCTHCGAPQVTLSEEIKAQMETESDLPGDPDPKPVPQAQRSQVWSVALRCVLFVAAIAAVLLLLAVVASPSFLLALLWIAVSPVVVLGLFQSRSPLTVLTTGFGARLGLVTGLAMGGVFSVFITGLMVALRYGTHSMAQFDTMMTERFAQVRVEAAAQQPGVPLPVWLQKLDIPEFRAGSMLAGMGMMFCLLLVLTTAGGAFAGFVRSQKRAGA